VAEVTVVVATGLGDGVSVVWASAKVERLSVKVRIEANLSFIGTLHRGDRTFGSGVIISKNEQTKLSAGLNSCNASLRS
jgi:hypothetical protein